MLDVIRNIVEVFQPSLSSTFLDFPVSTITILTAIFYRCPLLDLSSNFLHSFLDAVWDIRVRH